MSLYIESIPNRNSPPAILLRQARREGNKIKRKTIANLSKMPPELIDGIRALLKGGVVYQNIEQVVDIKRALPHGHIAAVLGTLRKLGLDSMLLKKSQRMRNLAIGAIVERMVSPASKLATARHLTQSTASSSLGALLALGNVSGNEMLDMLDWLRKRQAWIEKSLANRHVKDRLLILYDVTSSYLEGECCPLAAYGYNRDRKKGKKQIVFGLLCSAEGCPVAVEVFAGNTADPMTVAAQVTKIQQRFDIAHVALVGDRGMITTARIRADLQPAGLDWISALKTSDIRKLVQQPDPPLDAETVIPDEVAEILSPQFPGERLMVCLNPRLQQLRARKREELLCATEEVLKKIASIRHTKSDAHTKQSINRRIGRETSRWKVAKHFDIQVTDEEVIWSRNQQRIDAEAALDGMYVIRTNLAADSVSATQAVEAYKGLSRVERAFRSMKSTQLEIRPVFVYNAEHVRGHVFLCMLAYYVEWHMRTNLAPILFQDHEPQAARAMRSSPVQKAQVSDSAKLKAKTGKTEHGLDVHSFSTLLDDLKTLTINKVVLPGQSETAFTAHVEPTPLQQKAFELLEINPTKISIPPEMFPVR